MGLPGLAIKARKMGVRDWDWKSIIDVACICPDCAGSVVDR